MSSAHVYSHEIEIRETKVPGSASPMIVLSCQWAFILGSLSRIYLADVKGVFAAIAMSQKGHNFRKTLDCPPTSSRQRVIIGDVVDPCAGGELFDRRVGVRSLDNVIKSWENCGIGWRTSTPCCVMRLRSWTERRMRYGKESVCFAVNGRTR